VSAHREHPFVAQAAAQEDRPRLSLRAGALVVGAIVIGFAALAPLTFGVRTTKATPIERAPIVDTPLPAVSAPARNLQARLEDWRAGYEAAVENGCQIKPLFNAPVAPTR
jgi:hypothetical protein